MTKRWFRVGATVVAVGAFGLASAGTAHADVPTDYEYGGLFGSGEGYTLKTTAGALDAATTGVYPEENEAGKARTYRLDTKDVPDDLELVYDKSDWKDTSVKALAQANWIINNSYPTVDAQKLAEKAGADLTGLDANMVAHTGTQAAIWAVTEDVELEADPTGEGDDVDAAVVAIADYLGGKAGEQGEPSDEFTIEGEATWDGKRLGPFHFEGVDDEGWADAFGPDGDIGGKPVDENGEDLEHPEDGQEFYIEPKDGVTELTLFGIAADSPKAGTLMLPRDDDSAPTLMLAEDAGYGVHAHREVTIGGEGGDAKLPVTGASLTGVIGVGAALLIGGAVVLLVARRRSSV